MMKRYLLIALITLVTVGTVQGALAPDTLQIRYSNHGTQPNKPRQTLAIISLPKVAGNLEIQTKLEGIPHEQLLECSVLLADSLATRDLDDYKGRIPYQVVKTAGIENITLTAKQLKGHRYAYLTVMLAPTSLTAETTPKVSLQVTNVHCQGAKLPLRQQKLGERIIYPVYEALFVPGDDGSKYYRIPAMLKTAKGTLLVMADRRKHHSGDLPQDIDIVLKRSDDAGRTWSKSQLIIPGKGFEKGFGDAALVQCPSGKIIMICVGGKGLWNSTPKDPIRTYTVESTDDGKTWSAPKDITNQIFGEGCTNPERAQWLAAFCASGHGICSATGRVMFVTAVRENQRWNLSNYLLYSDDEGENWHLSERAFEGGDEAKVVELPNGDILMSVRNKHRGDRYFVSSSDNGIHWTATARYAKLHDPVVNGTPIVVHAQNKPYLLHSLPKGPGRQLGRIYAYDLQQWKWVSALDVAPGPNAYSDILQLDNDNIAYISEEDNNISLVYIQVPLSRVLPQPKAVK